MSSRQPTPEIINLRRVVVLGAEPVTLTEAKAQLIVTFADDDLPITELITKARQFVENYCNNSIVYQRVELIGRNVGKLPYGPVIGIETVEDSQGTPGSGPASYSSSTSGWSIDGDSYCAGGSCSKQRIVYTAGNFCPPDLKQVILKLITHLYENRGRTLQEDDIKKILKEANYYQVLLWI